MNHLAAHQVLVFWLAGCPLLVACRGKTSPPDRPDYQPESIAAEAIALLDKNADGELSDEEAKGAPGLAEGFERADANQDGKLTQEEIAQRVTHWRDSMWALCAANVQVRVNGRPLPDAEIVLEPEPFLTRYLQEASAWTDLAGMADLSSLPRLPGMHAGYYRVRITYKRGSRQLLPTRYNEKSELGVEITDDRTEEDHVIQFPLKSR